MAFLAQILIPPLASITAGLAVGLVNASQAEHSDFSLQIGNKVFTTSKPFPLYGLPFELREEILFMALELSKAFLPLPPPLLPPDHPFLDPFNPLYHNPMNPHHPLYVGPTGERNINGYPTCAWRWITVSREWWAVLRPKLWERVTLRGRWAYSGFLRNLEDPDSAAIKGFVRSLELKEGAVELHQMYSAMGGLHRLDRVIYAPSPVKKYLFPFGINLVPSDPGPRSITLKVPFEIITNPSSRGHLLNLPRLSALDLTFSTFSFDIATFLASLAHLQTLTLRMPALPYSLLAPFSTSNQPLTKLDIHVLSIPEEALDSLRSFLRESDRLSAACTIWSGVGSSKSVVHAPSAEATLALAAQEEQVREEANKPHKHWERTTNLRLLGGLVGLRMESSA